MANSGSDVKKIVSAATFKRGVEVFESGKLTKISFRGSELEIGEASCLGSGPGEVYHVSFSIPLGEGSIGLDKLVGKCTCPVRSKSKAPCKHIVALLLSRIKKLEEGVRGTDAKEMEAASYDNESTEPLEDDAVLGSKLPDMDCTADEVGVGKSDRGLGKEKERSGRAETVAQTKRRVLPNWITNVEEPVKKRGRQKKESDGTKSDKDEVKGRKAAPKGKQSVKRSDAVIAKPVRKRRVGTVVESESSEGEVEVSEAAMPWEEEGGEDEGGEESDLELEIKEPVKRRKRSEGGDGPSIKLRGRSQGTGARKGRSGKDRKEASSWGRDKDDFDDEEIEAPVGRFEEKVERVEKKKRGGKKVVVSSGDEESEGANSLGFVQAQQNDHVGDADLRGNLEDEAHTDIAGMNVEEEEVFREGNGDGGLEKGSACASAFESRSEEKTTDVEWKEGEMEEEEEIVAKEEEPVDLNRGEDGGSLPKPIEGTGVVGRGGEVAKLDYDDIFDMFITPAHKKIGKGMPLEPPKTCDVNEGATSEARCPQNEEKYVRIECDEKGDDVALLHRSNIARPTSQDLESVVPIANGKKPKKKMKVAGMLL